MDLPQSVKNTLWPYDIDRIDLQNDKNIIIFNVLNFGTLEAVSWLQKNYSEKEIKEIIATSNKNNWSTYFLVSPQTNNRFV